MGIKIRKKLVFFVLLLIGAILFLAGYLGYEAPPFENINKAREQISIAESLKAQEYAPAPYAEALMIYDSAMREWKRQNNRFFVSRNYSLVKTLVEKSEMLACSAIDQTAINKKAGKDNLEVKIRNIKKRIGQFEQTYKHYPVSKNDLKKLIKARLFLEEAVMALKNNRHGSSGRLIRQSDSLIVLLNKQYTNLLKEYFKLFTFWSGHVKETIKYSEKNETYAIIIDKFAHNCYLYENGRLVETLSVELGQNWPGDKKIAGDKTTPEGAYKIIGRKSGEATKYYKALLINYPNEQDIALFKKNQKNGTISKKAKIGSLIEIHGHGGKGVDWTDGCIALTDTDMDVLYRKCMVGTPVTIVGSIKPLEEILKN